MQTIFEEIAATESAHDERVTGLAYNTLYYVFYSDPYLAGGAVTYQVASTKAAVLASSGNMYVGSILTPAAGGPDTIGNNDGGAGAQNGMVITLLMSATNGAALGGNGAIANPQNQLNADQVHFSVYTASGNGANNFAGQVLFGPPAISTRYSSANLVIMRALPINSIATSFPVYTLKYTVDAWATTGTTVESLAGGTTLPKGTVSIPLPLGLNLSQIQVNFDIQTESAPSGAIELDAYGAWIVLVQ